MHGFWAGTNAMRYDNFYCIWSLGTIAIGMCLHNS